jgi:hypothetical protein
MRFNVFGCNYGCNYGHRDTSNNAEDKTMLKKIGIPALALCAMTVLIPPQRANAAVRFGVFIGGPAYAYPAYPPPPVYYNAYPAYPAYPYSAPVYVYPYRYRPYWRSYEYRGYRGYRRHEWRERRWRR